MTYFGCVSRITLAVCTEIGVQCNRASRDRARGAAAVSAFKKGEQQTFGGEHVTLRECPSGSHAIFRMLVRVQIAGKLKLCPSGAAGRRNFRATSIHPLRWC